MRRHSRPHQSNEEVVSGARERRLVMLGGPLACATTGMFATAASESMGGANTSPPQSVRLRAPTAQMLGAPVSLLEDSGVITFCLTWDPHSPAKPMRGL